MNTALPLENCRACNAAQLSPLIDFGSHPIAHRFLGDSSANEYVHQALLSFCEVCGLMQLSDPIPPEILYGNYTVLSSFKPEPHIAKDLDLLDRLIDLSKTAHILEVGSNDGVFLNALKARGWSNAIGIEPAKDAFEAAQLLGVKTIHAFFNLSTAGEFVRERGQCDLLIARQVLEHVMDLRGFCDALRLVLKPGGYLLIEVPNAAMALAAPDYSSVWEEHVNYFTLESLTAYLARYGISILHNETTLFSGEILTVLGRFQTEASSAASTKYLPELIRQIQSYQAKWPIFRDSLVAYLREHSRTGGRTVIYGAGCRACSLINFTGISPFLECIFDDEPSKQGKYMPGSHLPIHSGDKLEPSRATLCLLAVNAENEAKVTAKHAAFRRNGGTFYSVFPPSENLLPIWNDL